ncbi:hypothetical protein GPECTOR_6g583 [Gonium pectorale]|uniref:Peptidase M11 gametolysin domain-containing protein n=1 Tax=Gonium pectorale TaxID=33097 RepID=A0A150GUW5_GONPE|nr:hypothetical protein GPECTOR_6g583 [Gonium pectorale]|eukprot:KXZ53666.1 hypothetical protein GPECTOR_6g583 [Gonium pectorale]
MDAPFATKELKGWLHEPQVGALASLTGLTSLHLLGGRLLPQGAESLEPLSRLTNLRSLSLQPRINERLAIDDDDPHRLCIQLVPYAYLVTEVSLLMSYTGSMTQLRSLELRGLDLPYDNLPQLASLHSALTFLRVQNLKPPPSSTPRLSEQRHHYDAPAGPVDDARMSEAAAADLRALFCSGASAFLPLPPALRTLQLTTEDFLGLRELAQLYRLPLTAHSSAAGVSPITAPSPLDLRLGDPSERGDARFLSFGLVHEPGDPSGELRWAASRMRALAALLLGSSGGDGGGGESSGGAAGGGSGSSGCPRGKSVGTNMAAGAGDGGDAEADIPLLWGGPPHGGRHPGLNVFGILESHISWMPIQAHTLPGPHHAWLAELRLLYTIWPSSRAPPMRMLSLCCLDLGAGELELFREYCQELELLRLHCCALPAAHLRHLVALRQLRDLELLQPELDWWLGAEGAEEALTVMCTNAPALSRVWMKNMAPLSDERYAVPDPAATARRGAAAAEHGGGDLEEARAGQDDDEEAAAPVDPSSLVAGKPYQERCRLALDRWLRGGGEAAVRFMLARVAATAAEMRREGPSLELELVPTGRLSSAGSADEQAGSEDKADGDSASPERSKQQEVAGGSGYVVSPPGHGSQANGYADVMSALYVDERKPACSGFHLKTDLIYFTRNDTGDAVGTNGSAWREVAAGDGVSDKYKVRTGDLIRVRYAANSSASSGRRLMSDEPELLGIDVVGESKAHEVYDGAPIRIKSMIYLISTCGWPAPLTVEEARNIYFRNSMSISGYHDTCTYNKVKFLEEDTVIIGPVEVPCTGSVFSGVLEYPYDSSQYCGAAEQFSWRLAGEAAARATRCGWAGLASVGCGGSTCSVYIKGSYAQSLTVAMHEISHTTGLSHAGRGFDEYGDTSDVMGNSGSSDGYLCMNPGNQLRVGWNSPIATLLPSSTNIVGNSGVLKTWVIPPESATDVNHLYLLYSVNDVAYPNLFISFRTRTATFDNILTSGNNNRVFVHAFNGTASERDWNRTLLLAVLSSGGIYTGPFVDTDNDFFTGGGVRIQVLSITPGVSATVRVAATVTTPQPAVTKAATLKVTTAAIWFPSAVAFSSASASKPAAAKPTTAQPAAAQPTTAQPAAAKPTTTQPAAAKPTTTQPDAAQPTTAQFAAAAAEASAASTLKPTTTQPAAAQPTTAQPAAAKPTTTQPAAAKPTTAQPAAIKPVTNTVAAESATTAPLYLQPTTLQPTLGVGPSSSPSQPEASIPETSPQKAAAAATEEEAAPAGAAKGAGRGAAAVLIFSRAHERVFSGLWLLKLCQKCFYLGVRRVDKALNI